MFAHSNRARMMREDIGILYEQIVTEIRFSENRNDSAFVEYEHQRMLMSSLIICALFE